MRFDAKTMSYNPPDDDGDQKIDVGDRVSVTGKIDKDLFEGQKLDAESIVTLSSAE